jgi:hypothetical protein
MERRDFCGIIASPLLRKFVPPSPECGGIVGPATTHIHSNYCNHAGPPLSVENLMAAFGDLKRRWEADGEMTLTFPPDAKFQWAPWEPR